MKEGTQQLTLNNKYRISPSCPVQYLLPRQQTKGTCNMWTEERRRKQAEIVKKTEPTRHSTGPRSKAGKARVSQNAYKHGMRGGIYRQVSSLLSENNKLLKGLKWTN